MVVPKPPQFHDLLEEVAEQEQPDHRLDQGDDRVGGLPCEHHELTLRHVPGLRRRPSLIARTSGGDEVTGVSCGGGRRFGFGVGLGVTAARVAEVDVVEGGPGHGRGGHRDARPAPARRAARGTAAAPSSARALSRRPSTSTSCTPAQRAEGADEQGTAGSPTASRSSRWTASPRSSPLSASGRALDDDPAAVDDGDALGEPVGLFEVVGGEQDRQPLLAGEPGDLVPHRGARLGVQSGGGLVEEEHLGPVHQTERDVEAALHAAGVPFTAGPPASARPKRSSSSSPGG